MCWLVSLSACAKKCIVGSLGVMYSFTVMTNSTSPPALLLLDREEVQLRQFL